MSPQASPPRMPARRERVVLVFLHDHFVVVHGDRLLHQLPVRRLRGVRPQCAPLRARPRDRRTQPRIRGDGPRRWVPHARHLIAQPPVHLKHVRSVSQRHLDNGGGRGRWSSGHACSTEAPSAQPLPPSSMPPSLAFLSLLSPPPCPYPPSRLLLPIPLCLGITLASTGTWSLKMMVGLDCGPAPPLRGIA